MSFTNYHSLPLLPVKTENGQDIIVVSRQNLFKTTFTLFLCESDAAVNGQLEPTHLKFSPLFTSWRKLQGQDSPSVHLVFKKMG